MGNEVRRPYHLGIIHSLGLNSSPHGSWNTSSIPEFQAVYGLLGWSMILIHPSKIDFRNFPNLSLWLRMSLSLIPQLVISAWIIAPSPLPGNTLVELVAHAFSLHPLSLCGCRMIPKAGSLPHHSLILSIVKSSSSAQTYSFSTTTWLERVIYENVTWRTLYSSLFQLCEVLKRWHVNTFHSTCSLLSVNSCFSSTMGREAVCL